MRRGFTLVELSIVLVIIGLLVGGILVGQSLISSAKISSQIQQIAHFDAGVGAFKAKYKFLPGDAPGFGGNGNNSISGNVCSESVHEGEQVNVWSIYFLRNILRI